MNYAIACKYDEKQELKHIRSEARRKNDERKRLDEETCRLRELARLLAAQPVASSRKELPAPSLRPKPIARALGSTSTTSPALGKAKRVPARVPKVFR
jgi:hypothetical protein